MSDKPIEDASALQEEGAHAGATKEPAGETVDVNDVEDLPDDDPLDVELGDVIATKDAADPSEPIGESEGSAEPVPEIAPPPSSPRHHEFVAGKYHLLATLGRGGMASVYLGVTSGPGGFNKLLVIKKLHDGHAEDPSFVTMFLDEARLAARLNHPNIVHTYEVSETDDGYLLVMEYLEGQSFRRIARAENRRDRRLDPHIAAHLVSDALRGLHYAHEMRDYDGAPLGIVHRDVSPQNLFVTYDGTVKVLDFGIAKATLNLSDTKDGVLKGKFAYMAPEVPGGGRIDRRTDIFAAGVVLWELLTGNRLFPGGPAERLADAASRPIAPPSALAPGISPELDSIVLRALEHAPEHRFATALEMANALSDHLAASGTPVRREDVAKLMQELFADARDVIAHTIQMYMASRARDSGPGEFIPVRPSLLPALPSVPPSTSQAAASIPPPATIPPLPNIPQGPPLPVIEPLTELTLPSGRAPRTAPRRRWVPAAVAASFAMVAVGAGVGFVRPSTAPPENSRKSEPAATAGSFHLTVMSDPPEADVEWDGKVVGRTPLVIDLPPGAQTFVVSRDGYLATTAVVNVEVGMTGHDDSRTIALAPRANVARTGADTRGGAERSPTTPAADTRKRGKTAGTPEPTTAVAQMIAPSPPAAPSAERVLPFGPEMTRPVLLSGADLVYTREAILTRTSGTMIAKCTITTDGTLRNCRIIKGLPYLDKSMLDALAKRRYSPVMYQGKPVPVEYVFNLKVAPPP